VGLAPNWKTKVSTSGSAAGNEKVSNPTEKLGGLQDDDAIGTRPDKGKGREVQVSTPQIRGELVAHMHIWFARRAWLRRCRHLSSIRFRSSQWVERRRERRYSTSITRRARHAN
jgi:hypothetical protein